MGVCLLGVLDVAPSLLIFFSVVYVKLVSDNFIQNTCFLCRVYKVAISTSSLFMGTELNA